MSNKNLFLDIHALQTVPPSNINRDDTGSPKTAQYGGVTRARVSSQCWKNAIRDYFKGRANKGIRTRNWIEKLCEICKQKYPDLDETEILEKVAENFAEALIDKEKNNRSQEVKKLKDKLIKNKYDVIHFFTETQGENFVDEIMKKDVDKNKFKDILSDEPSIDIALFGRMVASNPILNEDASCQVAHAISTHAIQTEFDFFTAVDEYLKENNFGASMLGTLEYNSATLYRYANVAIHELFEQLDGQKEEVINALKLFIEAFAKSMPTGKINACANQTLPQVFMINLRKDRPVSLVSAFENPVKQKDGYLKQSAKRMFDELKNIEKFVEKPIFSLLICVNDIEAIDNVEIKVSLNELLEDFGERLKEEIKES